jgi:hypothetical protein
VTELLDHALAWARRGFRVFPLRVGDKRPAGYGWRKYATTNEEVIAKWWAEKPYNIGVLGAGLIVVDVDVKNDKPGLLSYAELELPTDTLTVRTPSRGLHYYFTGPDTDNKAGLAPGIDIRSFKGYVVAPGSVTAKGVYSVEHDLPLLPAPESLVTRCGAPRQREKIETNHELDTDTATVLATDWLERSAPLAVEGDSGDQTTYAVACKLRDFGLSEDHALDLLLDHWNDRCSPPWEPDELTVKIENAFEFAQNPAGVLNPKVEFDGVNVEPPAPRPQRDEWIWQGDPVNFNQQWLFYQKLPRVGTALLVAPSGAGKTFLVAHLAAALGSESAFFGTRPDEKLGSLMLAAEGVSGIAGRLSVLGEGLPIASRPVGALSDGKAVAALYGPLDKAAALLRERHGVGLGIITIDTMAASGLLIDENDNSQCAAAVKNLEGLAARYQCLVLVTHHPPKNSSGARGGSALHAGFDTVLEIFPSGGPVRYLECTKSRDASTGKWGSFTLLPQTIGFDTHEPPREVTTCTVSTGEEARPAAGPQPKHTARFMEAFDFARAGAELAKDAPVLRTALRKSFGELVSFPGGPSAATKAFNKCAEWCLASGGAHAVQDGDAAMLLEGSLPIELPSGSERLAKGAA